MDAINALLSEGSHTAFVEGAGHIVPAEKPADCNARVLEFLKN